MGGGSLQLRVSAIAIGVGASDVERAFTIIFVVLSALDDVQPMSHSLVLYRTLASADGASMTEVRCVGDFQPNTWYAYVIFASHFFKEAYTQVKMISV